MKFGSQGRNRIPAPTNAISASRTSPRLSSLLIQIGISATTEQAPPGPHPDGDRQQPEQQRERVGGGFACAECPDPEVQQEVEERRRAVVAEQAGNLAKRVRGDARRDRLVHPELSADVPG